MWTAIHITDWLLWLFMAPSVIYVAFYAFVSLFPSRPSPLSPHPSDIKHQPSNFLILFPAYKEDAVIVHSVRQCLEQIYPKEYYHIGVISDHMQEETNELLRQLPITLFTPQFEKSSKAKALQYAIEHTEESYDYLIILDADNMVLPEFLEQVNASCQQGYRAIQCHRCAKNSDNDVAVLDGISEEINNSLFRKAHNTIGISSALIGSGMCFEYEWFKNHVGLFETAVEDREMEIQLMKEHIFIKYEEHIPVYDEKVSSSENFQRQRLRWMTGQIQSLLLMLPYLPTAIKTGNIHYIDKTMQQALIPRSILLVLSCFFAILMTVINLSWSIKWWVLFLIISLSIFIAIPKRMRTKALFGKFFSTIKLVGLMLGNLLKMDLKSKDFLHTTHDK
ncbi:glycosyltransferase family 2 protein [Prevotella sp. tf2-5]|uniref:glycosyltransferase n=1 Tax=Prevotella sp. tf2-5 TaxID=1761889 RepID=UPI0008EF58E1|nr:glycosyltransferase [Prevotella sp. tf2-5]SFO53359.1 Glycosyltransferase, catalytic subunit of cellulose synthase and poly-beta-1,6-N-acetylglucosamine synthase [Prevotella sp. tf2-5]